MTVFKKNFWIPAMYFMQGLPFALVNLVSPIFYKTLGFKNSDIAFLTSLFLFPWIIKFLISPILEVCSTKRHLALWMESVFVPIIVLLVGSIYFSQSIYLSGLLFLVMAVCSATHDVVTDGLYIEFLSLRDKAKYLGLKSVFYHLGVLCCQIVMIYFLGFLLSQHYFFNDAWLYASLFLILIIFIMVLCNYYYIPRAQNKIQNHSEGFQSSIQQIQISFQTIWREIKTFPYLFSFVIFIVFYHFPETQLMKMIPLFLLDHTDQGGLNLNLKDAGFLYGGLSSVGTLIGISVSGLILNRKGLKKCLLLFSVLPILGYLSFFFISYFTIQVYYLIALSLFVTYFFYGLSNGAYLLYLLNGVKDGASMSLYAGATALMLLGTMLAGSISGYIQSLLGYTNFFVWIIISGIIVILIARHETRKLA